MRKETGITLVALIITIIILLIIASVAISTIVGEDGIFSKALGAANKYNQSAKNESGTIKDLLYQSDSENTALNPIIDKTYAVGFELKVPELIHGSHYLYRINTTEYKSTERSLEILNLEPNTQYEINISALDDGENLVSSTNLIYAKTKPGKKLYYKGNEYNAQFTTYKQSSPSVNMVKNDNYINMTYNCSSGLNWFGGIKKTLGINNTVSYYTKIWIYVEEVDSTEINASVGTIGTNSAGYYPTEILAECKINKGVGLYELNISNVSTLNELFFNAGMIGNAGIKISNIWIEGLENLTIDDGAQNNIDLQISNIGMKTADIKVPGIINAQSYRYCINGKIISSTSSEYTTRSLIPARENSIYVQVIDENFAITKTKVSIVNGSKWLYYEGNEFEDSFETYKQVNASVTLNKSQSNLVVSHSCSSSVSWCGGIKKTLNIDNSTHTYTKIKVYVDAAVGTTNITAGVGQITSNSGGYYPSTISASCNISSGAGIYQIDISNVTTLKEFYIGFSGTGTKSVTVSKIEIE